LAAAGFGGAVGFLAATGFSAAGFPAVGFFGAGLAAAGFGFPAFAAEGFSSDFLRSLRVLGSGLGAVGLRRVVRFAGASSRSVARPPRCCARREGVAMSASRQAATKWKRMRIDDLLFRNTTH
jgi:hypothetical protein